MMRYTELRILCLSVTLMTGSAISLKHKSLFIGNSEVKRVNNQRLTEGLYQQYASPNERVPPELAQRDLMHFVPLNTNSSSGRRPLFSLRRLTQSIHVPKIAFQSPTNTKERDFPNKAPKRVKGPSYPTSVSARQAFSELREAKFSLIENGSQECPLSWFH